MLVTLICKKREFEGKKWTNYSTLSRNAETGKEEWFDVKFVKNCTPPQQHAVAEGIYRAFVDLTPDSKFNPVRGYVTEKNGKEYKTANILFVESYNAIEPEKLKKAITAEAAKIEKYRAEKERERLNFLAPFDEEESPFN